MASGLCDHWSFLRPPFGDAAASSSTASTTATASTASTTTPTNELPERALSSAKACDQKASEKTRHIVIARANSRDCDKYFTELKALLDGRFADDTQKLKQLLPGKDIDRLWGGGVARPGQRKSWQTMSI